MKLTAQRIQKGFTLIELLVVIGILAILLAITLIAINPAKQFASANDTKRSSDVNAILNGIGQYMADNKGVITVTNLGATPAEIGSGANQVDLCPLLVTKYLAALPADPQSTNASPTGSVPCTPGVAYHTGYTISKSATDSRVTVSAVSETNPGTPITVTR